MVNHPNRSKTFSGLEELRAQLTSGKAMTDIPHEVCTALKKVVDYIEEDERAHYASNLISIDYDDVNAVDAAADDGIHSEHIYVSIRVLRRFLDTLDPS